MLNHNVSFENMSNGQLRTNAIENDRILVAMGNVGRENFVPEGLKATAYVDEDLPLGHGRWMLEPLILATMLEKAAIEPGDTVLVIAGGYGYAAAVVAQLAQNVVMVEDRPELAGIAREKLAGLGHAVIEVVEGSLTEGAAAYRPYDAILIEGAVDFIPASLSAQLKDGGRLVTLLAGAPRSGSTKALCQYLLMTREGQLLPTRHEGSAFAHRLAPFLRPATFTL